MVQCQLCQMWVHCECVGEQAEKIVGMWSCLTCRGVPKIINQLTDRLSVLEWTMSSIKENNADLVKLVKAQCTTNDSLKDES